MSEERRALGPRTVNDPERYVRSDQNDPPRLTEANAGVVDQVETPQDAEELLELGFRDVFYELGRHV